MSAFKTLDRTIAFQRIFVTLTGSIPSALMLSQAVYWSLRTESEDGSFHKSRDEWQDETGLTHEQQESARKRLRALGFWTEKNERLTNRIFYRVDEDGLDAALSDIPVSRNRETRLGGNRETRRPEPGNTVSLRSETTQETTKKEKETFQLSPEIEEKKKNKVHEVSVYGAIGFLPKEFDTEEFRESMGGFIEMRKRKKKPLTPFALQLVCVKVSAWPAAKATRALNKSTLGGYDGIFDPDENANGKPNLALPIGNSRKDMQRFL